MNNDEVRLVWDSIEHHGGEATGREVWQYLKSQNKKWESIGLMYVLLDRMKEAELITQETIPRSGGRGYQFLYKKGPGTIGNARQRTPAPVGRLRTA